MTISLKPPKNFGNFERRLRELGKKFKGKGVEIGVLEKAYGIDKRRGKPKGITIAQEAFYNCKGVPELNIPPRDYQTQSIDRNSKRWAQATEALLKRKMPEDKILEAIGIIAAEDTRHTIETGNFEPNKPKTLKRKGNKPPLIDYGDLVESIRFEVVNSDGSKNK